MVRVAEGREGNEYIITRLDHISPPINIINIYGDQEKADKEIGRKEKVLESWNRLLQDLKEIESRKEHLLILGDLNRKVGTGILGIEGNNPNISFGGQLVRDLLYVLLNNLPVATGGPWTWVSRSDPLVRSCLDLGIVSSGLAPFVSNFVVDSK